MTLTITDMGDEWQYTVYKATNNADWGMMTELVTTIEEAPWSLAESVEVTIETPTFEVDYTGWIDKPEMRVDDSCRMTLVLYESPVY